jgi:hypothetical protein
MKPSGHRSDGAADRDLPSAQETRARFSLSFNLVYIRSNNEGRVVGYFILDAFTSGDHNAGRSSVAGTGERAAAWNGVEQRGYKHAAASGSPNVLTRDIGTPAWHRAAAARSRSSTGAGLRPTRAGAARSEMSLRGIREQTNPADNPPKN